MDRLYSENAQMKAKTEQLDEENKNLELGLKEVCLGSVMPWLPAWHCVVLSSSCLV